MVIGGHGEFILPVWSSVTVCGGKNSEPLKKLMDDYPEKLKLQGIPHSPSRIQMLERSNYL